MTIEEKLKPYKDTNLSFYEAYLDCLPIEEMEGLVLEDAKYAGYAITYEGNRYFTDEGIKGWYTGTFYIKDGKPYELVKFPGNETISLVADLVSQMPYNKEVSTNTPKIFEIERYFSFEIEHYLRKNWYDSQITSIK